MSDSREPQPIIDRYWQPLVILFGIGWVLLWAFYDPRR